MAATAEGATISVADTGIGIDPAELPHIFERFYRGSRSNEARGSGSGLGLAIVQSIVEMHGGRIAVESRVGQGSRVHRHLAARSSVRRGHARGRTGRGPLRVASRTGQRDGNFTVHGTEGQHRGSTLSAIALPTRPLTGPQQRTDHRHDRRSHAASRHPGDTAGPTAIRSPRAPPSPRRRVAPAGPVAPAAPADQYSPRPRRDPSGSKTLDAPALLDPGTLVRAGTDRTDACSGGTVSSSGGSSRRASGIGSILAVSLLSAVLAAGGTVLVLGATGDLDRNGGYHPDHRAGQQRRHAQAGDHRRVVGDDRCRRQGQPGRRPHHRRRQRAGWLRRHPRDRRRLGCHLRQQRLDPDQSPRRQHGQDGPRWS